MKACQAYSALGSIEAIDIGFAWSTIIALHKALMLFISLSSKKTFILCELMIKPRNSIFMTWIQYRFCLIDCKTSLSKQRYNLNVEHALVEGL